MKKPWQTILFLGICAVILVFFLMAPESTTPRMPADDDHPRRSADYAACLECHPGDTLPSDHVLPDGKPPGGKFKCYFCHKRVKTAAFRPLAAGEFLAATGCFTAFPPMA